jgi:hypothetical protein
MFTRLFRPKWEQADPATRAAAAAEPETPPEILARLALGDPDPSVRVAAVGRLAEITTLARVVAEDKAEAARAAARARLVGLLGGPDSEAPSMQERTAFLGPCTDPDLILPLARGAKAVDVRLAAIEHLSDPALLCEVACQDPVAAVRQAAFARISDPAAWEVVARETRDRDRQLSRLARDKIEALQRQTADLASAERLCAEMEALGSAPPELATAYRRVARDWELVATPPPEELRQRFERARSVAAEALARREATEAARRRLCDELEALRPTLPAPSVEAARAAAARIREAVADAAGRWAELAAAEVLESPATRRFDSLRAELERLAAEAEQDADRASTLQALIEEAKALTQAAGTVNESRLAGLRERWDGQPPPEHPPLAEPLQASFRDLAKELQGRVKREAGQRQQALEEAEAELPKLEAALTEGTLHVALSHLDRIRHRLRLAGDSDRKRTERLERRIHRLQPRIEELRRWRHWGSRQAREELCSEIEALAASALDAAAVAAKVRAAREAWRHIDRDEGPAAQTLWQRFDEACTRAYAPYQRQLEQQAQGRERNLETRRALLAEIEDLERGTDWERPDWREVERVAREARRRWQRVGPAPRQAAKPVERGFKEVLERIDVHLNGERAREVERRQGLIRRLQELAATADVRAAIREARQLQQQWRPSLPAEQAQEQALWEEFRQARDAVLARAEAERVEAEAERRQNLARKEAVCAGLEALLAGEPLDSPEGARALRELEQSWRDTGPVPRESERALEQRYRDLQARVGEARRDQARARAAARAQALRRRAEICAEIEQRALLGVIPESEAAPLLASMRGEWDRLPPIERDDETLLVRRRDRAASALTDPAARQALLEALPRNLAIRREICLEIEVLAGVDSPPELREERMRFQVARLSQTLREHRGEKASPRERLQSLERSWYRLGPAPAEHWPGLSARFETARAAATADLGEG